MYRYRPRAPARGKGTTVLQGMSDATLVSEGGPLERTIQEDLLALQATFFEILEDEFSRIKQSCANVHDTGRAFSCFKAAFRLHNFSTIYNYCPVRCDLDSFSQLLYSACLGLLVDAAKQPMNGLYAKHAAFATFSLYGLYKVNPYPCPLVTEKNLSIMPFGSLKMERSAAHANAEDKSRTRRTYKSPIRIDKHVFLILQQLRDFCLATVSQCDHIRLMLADGSTQSKTTELPDAINTLQKNCALEYDLMNVINKIQRDGLIELSEAVGPGTVEDLVGSRQFTGEALVTYNGSLISSLSIHEIMVMKKSRVSLYFSHHFSSLQDAAKRYVSSLRRMKSFDRVLCRGKTHQISLLNDTLARVSTMRDSSMINGYIDQIGQIMLHLTEILRPKDLLCNADPIILLNNSDQLPPTAVDEEACSSETFHSDRIEPLVGRASDNFEEKVERQFITNIPKILLPKTMSCDVGKSIENALIETEWDIIMRQFEEIIGTEANEEEEFSERSHTNFPAFQSFLGTNSEDLEGAVESSMDLSEREFDESSVITMVGKMALKSLLSLAAQNNESSVSVDKKEVNIERCLSTSSPSSPPDALSKSSSEEREQNTKKSSLHDVCSLSAYPKRGVDADQVSHSGSVVSDIGKQAIDKLIDVTIKGRKHIYKRGLHSTLASSSSLENAKRKRKRMIWQPSEKQVFSGSEYMNTKKSTASSDKASNALYTEHDVTSISSEIGMIALKDLLSNAISGTS